MRFENFDYKTRLNKAETENGLAHSVLVLVLVICFFVFKAWVFCQLWEWYLVSYFALKPLTLPVSIGILLLYQLLSWPKPQENTKSRSIVLMMPFVLLFFGWVGTFFL